MSIVKSTNLIEGGRIVTAIEPRGISGGHAIEVNDCIGVTESDLEDLEFRQGFAYGQATSTFGMQVKVIREARGITQEQLAEMTGTRQPNISRIERLGYEGITISTALKVSKALDAPLMFYLGTYSELLWRQKQLIEGGRPYFLVGDLSGDRDINPSLRGYMPPLPNSKDRALFSVQMALCEWLRQPEPDQNRFKEFLRGEALGAIGSDAHAYEWIARAIRDWRLPDAPKVHFRKAVLSLLDDPEWVLERENERLARDYFRLLKLVKIKGIFAALAGLLKTMDDWADAGRTATERVRAAYTAALFETQESPILWGRLTAMERNGCNDAVLIANLIELARAIGLAKREYVMELVATSTQVRLTALYLKHIQEQGGTYESMEDGVHDVVSKLMPVTAAETEDGLLRLLACLFEAVRQGVQHRTIAFLMRIIFRWSKAYDPKKFFDDTIDCMHLSRDLKKRIRPQLEAAFS